MFWIEACCCVGNYLETTIISKYTEGLTDPIKVLEPQGLVNLSPTRGEKWGSEVAGLHSAWGASGWKDHTPGSWVMRCSCVLLLSRPFHQCMVTRTRTGVWTGARTWAVPAHTQALLGRLGESSAGPAAAHSDPQDSHAVSLCLGWDVEPELDHDQGHQWGPD